ncbi:MAG: DUF1127 domain-containing protein [Bosea sp.]|nr:DUF1127 domain-containing protein [Bosea sp. (in: a-proteobacteria)]
MIREFTRSSARLAAYLRARKARDTLMSLDDRLLADIGISRGDIARAVTGHVPR